MRGDQSRGAIAAQHRTALDLLAGFHYGLGGLAALIVLKKPEVRGPFKSKETRVDA